MVRMPVLSFALAAALALTLAGCAGPNPFSRMSEPNMTPLSPKLQKLFEKTKPVCFGRFIIDVPVTTEVAWGPAKVPRTIVTYPDQAHRIKAEIDARLAHYAREKHNTAPSMLVAVRDGPHPGSKIIVGYDSPLDTYGVHIDAYFPLGPHAFVVNTSAGTDNHEWETVVSRITEVASRLRVRKEEEIPAEPGICIEGGFIAEGEGKYYELISIGFRILPDVHFSILGMAKDEAVAYIIF
ncbi:MAG: T6SS immunity protein Tli4 family protein [Nitrososphaerota archaeon]